MRIGRRLRPLGLAFLIAMLATACGPAYVLPRVHVTPPLKPVSDHAIRVLTEHPTLITKTGVLSVSPGPLTRGNLDVLVQPSGERKRVLVSIGGLDYKWLRRWQVAGDLVLLEIGTPPSAHPKSNEYLHVVLVADARTGKLLYQGPVAITTIVYLDPPYLVKAGPVSLLGRAQAVWLINVVAGRQVRVLFPPDTVGVGEVKNGRIAYLVRTDSHLRRRTLAIPKTGWLPYRNVSILKVSTTGRRTETAIGRGGTEAATAPPSPSVR
jgi:hypothetical protein